ncbi:hypothetical protein J6T93_07875 [bacterium]|nr:hypothetical protein [bacterium]
MARHFKNIQDLTNDPFADVSEQIKDIEPLCFDKGEDNTFIACFRRYLLSCGETLPYWLLMAISGAAFRLQIHYAGWRLVSLDAACGQNLLPNLYDLLGHELSERWICANRERNEAAKFEILDHLREGRPVIGLGLDGYARYGLVTGIRPGGILIAQDYSLSFYPHPVSEEMVWCYFLGSKKESKKLPDEKELFIAGFRQALKMAKLERVHGYYLGQTAYDYWYATLVNPMHHDPMNQDWRAQERNEGNYQLLKDLMHSRFQAARFCREAAIAFPECETFALACAGCYDGIVEEIKPFFDRRIVRPASHINIGRPWTLRERRQQAKALRRVADIEMRLMPLLEATLNTLQG